MPWISWSPQIENLQTNYYVVVLALDAHTELQSTEFFSVQDEAIKIIKWFLSQQKTRIHAIYGLSMGGSIAYSIAIDGRLEIDSLLLDGAPSVPSSRLLIWMMKHQYLKLL